MGEAPNTTRVRRVPECLEGATAIAREVAEIVVQRPAPEDEDETRPADNSRPRPLFPGPSNVFSSRSWEKNDTVTVDQGFRV
jgi:hypothetical protein